MALRKLKFDGKILMIGLGAVAKCALPMLFRHIDFDPKNLTVIDFANVEEAAKKVREMGATFVSDRLTKDNHGALLSKYVGKGDIIIELGWNIGNEDMVGWCHDHGVRFITTAMEAWSPEGTDERRQVQRVAHGKVVKDPLKDSLYIRYVKYYEQLGQWMGKGPTAVVDHGANPGMVSHFVKAGLKDIAARWLNDNPQASLRRDLLVDALQKKQFNHLAQHLGVKVIHVSERDTQISNMPKREGEFLNTWSVKGMWSESFATAEMTWGTHERNLPPRAHVPDFGPRHQLVMSALGHQVWVKSWVPSGETIGMVIRHGECLTMGLGLTVAEPDRVIYRPTINYAYCPCDSAVASLVELQMRAYELQAKVRVMNDDIIEGRDELGILLMGHDYTSWWIGSLLDIHQARRMVPGQSATTVQVAAGVLAGLFYMLEYPEAGAHLPDDLPHDYMLEVAMPYLEPFVSRQTDWTPHQNRILTFDGHGTQPPPEEDVWQFDSFLVRPF